MGGNWTLVCGTVLAAVGLFLSLPPRDAASRVIGGVLGAGALGIFASLAATRATGFSFEDPAHGFWSLAIVTLISSLATITSRNPVYCALWFGLSLLGTAGLFLWIGASFLAVATVVVYAGAILVTFLFVLMLASPEGNAAYDRLAWEPLLSATVGAVLVGILTTALMHLGQEHPELRTRDPRPVAGAGLLDRRATVEHPQAVAKLGTELFTNQLVAVQAAAGLLFVALVGAAAIVAHGRARDRVIAGALPVQNLPGPHPPIA